MRILVITSCTGRKKYKPENQLQYEDFTSSERLHQRTAELKDFEAPAVEMYTGQQHLYLMDGLRQLRATQEQEVIDLNIISAGYGLLGEKDVIVPYNITFQKLKKKEILERSNKLQIHEHVETLIAGYELVILFIGQRIRSSITTSFSSSRYCLSSFLGSSELEVCIFKFSIRYPCCLYRK